MNITTTYRSFMYGTLRGDIMSNLIITTGSVTTAVRTAKKLNSISNVNASVIHTPPAINTGGCSYSVKTAPDNLELVKKLYQENKIRFRKIYIEDTVNGESVYRDIS